jgi:transposase-like protein
VAYVDPELVERLYVREGGTVSGVAAHLDSSVYAVRAILRDRHVVVRGRGHPAKNVNPLLNDADWLRAQYLDQQRTVKEIAAEVGHSDHAVKDRLRKLQIPLRTNRQVIEMRTQRRRANLLKLLPIVHANDVRIQTRSLAKVHVFTMNETNTCSGTSTKLFVRHALESFAGFGIMN